MLTERIIRDAKPRASVHVWDSEVRRLGGAGTPARAKAYWSTTGAAGGRRSTLARCLSCRLRMPGSGRA